MKQNLQPDTKFKVELSNVGNPDFGQDPERPLPGTRNGWARVNTMQEAAAICRQYISKFDLGGGNWTGGNIEDSSGLIVANVSYNGRIWAGAKHDWKPGTKELCAS